MAKSNLRFKKPDDDFYSITTDWLGVAVATAIVIVVVLFFVALAFSADPWYNPTITVPDATVIRDNATGEIITETEHKRDPAVARAYLKSIGLTKTPKGCQVDHVIPLHCGGPDIVENLQLICGPSLKAKEKYERNCETFKEWSKQCLALQ